MGTGEVGTREGWRLGRDGDWGGMETGERLRLGRDGDWGGGVEQRLFL